jgi:selenocysteine-specific elongation factor
VSCIGTAGHVDHGKSTLVTALTGIDPDRLVEEKARGMTIDLGFAWLTLPSGREASIVDVPGHESFIKNMLAGVGGIDVALLVVAADEGVMPQTDEHLAILDLLGVRAGVVALTKCDLVDAEWLELVREEVAERLRPTTLANAPLIPCSAVTGVGLPTLRAALDTALDAAPPRRDLGRPRLPVDRVFTLTGFGTVATGTLQDGTLRAGQEVQVLPAGLKARIRGVQQHKHAVAEGLPGGRLAVNLAGIARSDLRRGDVLALPGTLRPTTAMDVRLEVLADAPRPLTHGAQLDVYLGAAEVPARVLLMDADELAPGASGWAQLRLRRPLVAARGDRFILRVPSPSQTIGGGTVIEALARRRRRRDASVLARLAALARGDPEELVLAALQPGASGTLQPTLSGYGGREAHDLARAAGLPEITLSAALAALVGRRAIVRVGAHVYAAGEWQRLHDDALRLLADYHARFPLRAGMPREEWRARLGLTARAADDALAALMAEDMPAHDVGGGMGASAESQGAYVMLAGHAPRLTAEQERAVAALLGRFHAAPFAPPTRPEVEAELGPELTALLIERGDLVKLSDAIVLERTAYQEAVRHIVAHLRTHETITVAEARDLLGTTRKYMLAIFEHLDERRITRRSGDDRILGPNAPALLEVGPESGGAGG